MQDFGPGGGGEQGGKVTLRPCFQGHKDIETKQQKLKMKGFEQLCKLSSIRK
jgi:hypothetical protein